MGRKAEIFQQDLEDVLHAQELMDRVQEVFGHVDILINNAGIFPGGNGRSVTPEKFNRVFNIKLCFLPGS